MSNCYIRGNWGVVNKDTDQLEIIPVRNYQAAVRVSANTFVIKEMTTEMIKVEGSQVVYESTLIPALLSKWLEGNS